MSVKRILISLIPVLLILSCKPHSWKVKTSKNLINSSETIAIKDAEIENWLNFYKDSVNKQMSKVIANTQVDLLAARSRGRLNQEIENQANLGRIAADYVQQAADNYMLSQYGSLSHFAILNHMGLRNSIFKGDITLGKVFEVMPFDNELVVLQLSGSQCDSLFNFIAQLGGSPISNLELTINDTTYTEAKARGLNFDSRKTYFVATSDFLLGGGDNFIMLKHPKKNN